MNIKKSAVISPCKQYRYELRRIWDETKPLVLFIGLNPSWADGEIEDNTSRVCINYANRWGFGGMLIGNLFAHRSKTPSDLYNTTNPIGFENDKYLKNLQAESNLVVCAWGGTGSLMQRDKLVLAFLEKPCCLKILKSGHPGHPLYKSANIEPIPYKISAK